MLKQFELILEGPGILFFDPYLLADFIQQNQIASNVVPLLLDEPALRQQVAQAGLLLPIAAIPPLDYQIVLNTSGSSGVHSDWVRFTTPPCWLTVGPQGRVIAADVYSLTEWDATFYQELGWDDSPAPQVATEMMPGTYRVIIRGFAEREYAGRGPKNIGYELCLDRVEEVPIMPEALALPDTDFVLWHPRQ